MPTLLSVSRIEAQEVLYHMRLGWNGLLCAFSTGLYAPEKSASSTPVFVPSTGLEGPLRDLALRALRTGPRKDLFLPGVRSHCGMKPRRQALPRGQE